MVKWNAEAYNESSHQQFKWGLELLDKLALKGSESLLDIGCGDGKLTIEIAKRVPDGNVVGIDNSEEMLSFARRNFPKDRYPNVDWQLMDAIEIDFNNEFDIAYSNAVLHWIKDHVAVLRGVKKSLKPNGKILFQMAGKGNALNAAQVLVDLISKEKWSKYFIYGVSSTLNYYGTDDYHVWLKDLGFVEKRVELFPKDASFQGREGMRGNIKSVWMTFTDMIPEHLRDQFIEELIDGFDERSPKDELGNYHIDMMRLEVEAGKI
jgi:trans-aconitate methyltransferase